MFFFVCSENRKKKKKCQILQYCIIQWMVKFINDIQHLQMAKMQISETIQFMVLELLLQKHILHLKCLCGWIWCIAWDKLTQYALCISYRWICPLHSSQSSFYVGHSIHILSIVKYSLKIEFSKFVHPYAIGVFSLTTLRWW